MGYILHKGKVMQISEDRKYKGYCSQNCKSSYTYDGQKYCAPFCDEAYKRLAECYEAEKPIKFLKEFSGFIKTKEEIKDEYRLRWGHLYKFKGFTYKRGKIFVCIIGETNSKEEYPQEYFDWEDLEEKANLFMKKNIISNNTNSGDIIVQGSVEKTIINGKVYKGNNIKISNNQVFVDGKLVNEALNDEKNIKKDLFQDVEDRGIGYIGVLESIIKEIESYGNETILKECSLPNKTWEETKEEYIRYYTDDTFETYWLWTSIAELSNNLAEAFRLAMNNQ